MVEVEVVVAKVAVDSNTTLVMTAEVDDDVVDVQFWMMTVGSATVVRLLIDSRK